MTRVPCKNPSEASAQRRMALSRKGRRPDGYPVGRQEEPSQESCELWLTCPWTLTYQSCEFWPAHELWPDLEFWLSLWTLTYLPTSPWEVCPGWLPSNCLVRDHKHLDSLLSREQLRESRKCRGDSKYLDSPGGWAFSPSRLCVEVPHSQQEAWYPEPRPQRCWCLAPSGQDRKC